MRLGEMRDEPHSLALYPLLVGKIRG